ncbi:hypothetical protein [Flavivirga aquatica]|uniref:hypothetical protein n=1 Tax=Flavivirga aquatica TaxID=1849968 RepID=UPI000F51481E|nr:hypothetical protein [Flavivirga aquatica]
MLKKLFDNIFLFVLFIGIIFIITGLGYRGKYQKVSSFNEIITVTGIIILTPYLIYFLYSYFKRKSNQENEKIKEKESFKNFLNDSKAIQLKLNNIKIISFDNKNIDYYTSETGKLDIKNSNQEKQVKIIIPYLDKKILYTFYTNKNLDDLRIHLAIQNETRLFINNHDNNKVYVDFNFLK